MIRSMTAFASAERSGAHGLLACELRAVNHRFLETSMRLPEELRAIEPQLRERIAQRVTRGKLDLGFRFRPDPARASTLRVNASLLANLSELALDTSARFPGLRVEFTELLRFPGLLDEAELDREGLHAEALALFDQVLEQFRQAREREGGVLARGMIERLDTIAAQAAAVRGWLPQIRAALRGRLEARLAELGQPLDPGRLEQELVLWLQKLDVDEELDRLDAHLLEARRVLGLDEAVGRRLDFLMQEFNREANTLGAKSVDPRTSAAAVEVKVLIEQLREQVQNIE